MAEHDDCTRLHELAPELALGVLTGQERAEARKHMATCPDCREYVLELTSVGDGLLALVPGAEPPVGFEDRVLSRMGLAAGQTPGAQVSAAQTSAAQFSAAQFSVAPTAPIPVRQPLAPASRPAHAPQPQAPVADLAQRRARRGATRW